MGTLPPRQLPLLVASTAEKFVAVSALNRLKHHLRADHTFKVWIERLLYRHIGRQGFVRILGGICHPLRYLAHTFQSQAGVSHFSHLVGLLHQLRE